MASAPPAVPVAVSVVGPPRYNAIAAHGQAEVGSGQIASPVPVDERRLGRSTSPVFNRAPQENAEIRSRPSSPMQAKMPFANVPMSPMTSAWQGTPTRATQRRKSPLASYVSASMDEAPTRKSRTSSVGSPRPPSTLRSPVAARSPDRGHVSQDTLLRTTPARNPDRGNASQDPLGQTIVYARPGPALVPQVSAETVRLARSLSPTPASAQSMQALAAVEIVHQDEMPKPALAPGATPLQLELREMRSRLEMQHAHHQQLSGMKPPAGSPGREPARSTPSSPTPATPAGSPASFSWGTSAAPQSREAPRLPPQIKILNLQQASDRHSLGHSSPSRDRPVAKTAHLEMEVKELRATMASQHVEQARSVQKLTRDLEVLYKEVQGFRGQDQSAMYPKSLIVPGLAEMEERMHELRAEVNQKISRQEARVDSWAAEIMKQQKMDAERSDSSSLAQDVQQLAQCVTDLRTHHDSLIMEVESDVVGLRELVRESQVANASDARFAAIQKALEDQRRDVERVKIHHEEVGVEALNKSNMVLMHAQRDMNTLRELLDNGLGSQGSKFEEETLETLKDLRAELDILGRRHDEFGAELAKKDGQITLQVEAEVHKSLQQQTGLAAEVDLMRADFEKSQANFQAEVDFMRRRLEEFRTDLLNKDIEYASRIQSHIGELQDSLQQQQALQENKRKEEAVEMIRHFQAESAYLRQKHEDMGTEKGPSTPMVKELQAEVEKLQMSFQQQQSIQDQSALSQQVSKEAQRREVEGMQQHLQRQKNQLDALHAAAKAEAEVRDAELRAVRQEVEEALRKLSSQVTDYTQRSFASVQMTTQPGDESEITSMSKLQSMQAAEMAKDAYTLHGQLQKVLGTERDARIQESIEVRALIRHLYEEMALLNADVKASCPSASTLGFDTQ